MREVAYILCVFPLFQGLCDWAKFANLLRSRNIVGLGVGLGELGMLRGNRSRSLDQLR